MYYKPIFRFVFNSLMTSLAHSKPNCVFSLVEILKSQIKDGLDVSGNKSKARGKEIYMYDWSKYKNQQLNNELF